MILVHIFMQALYKKLREKPVITTPYEVVEKKHKQSVKGRLKPATNAPPGSEGQDQQKSGPESQCEPFRKVVEDKLEDGLSRQRIYQDLRDEYGFEGSYYSVRRFVKRLREDRPIPFRRMECMPGDESQIDFGAAVHLLSGPMASVSVPMSFGSF